MKGNKGNNHFINVRNHVVYAPRNYKYDTRANARVIIIIIVIISIIPRLQYVYSSAIARDHERRLALYI